MRFKNQQQFSTYRRNPIFDAVLFLRSYFSNQPSYLILFVTANCNARCPHCFYRAEIETANTGQELKLGEITRIAKSLNPLIYLSLAGGEPFLRPDLAQIVEVFYRFSGLQYCNIVTNGFYTERIVEMVQTILNECPSLKLKIQVSIDDFESAHDENRAVPGIYQQAINTVRRLSTEIKNREHRLTVDIATCFIKSNKTRVVKLHDHLRRELKFDNYQLLYPRGSSKVKEVKEVTPEEYEAAVELIENKENHNYSLLSVVNRLTRRGIIDYLRQDKYPWACVAGRKLISITERGILQPCEILHQLVPRYNSNLADLRQFDFDVRAALASSKARAVIEHIKKTRCRCSFECAANCNVVFNKKNAIQVLLKWLMRK